MYRSCPRFSLTDFFYSADFLIIFAQWQFRQGCRPETPLEPRGQSKNLESIKLSFILKMTILVGFDVLFCVITKNETFSAE